MKEEGIIERHYVLKGVVRIIITLIVIGGLGYGGYYYVTNEILNPIKYLTNVNSYLENTLESHLSFAIENNSQKESKKSGKITFKTKSKDLEYLNHFNINYDVITGLEKEEIQTNIKLNEDSTNILDSNIYIQKDSIYLYSKELYNEVLLLNKLNNNIFATLKESNKNISINEIKNVINNYTKYIIESMEEADISSKFVDYYKVKHTYEINDNNRNKVQEKYNTLLKNDKILNSFNSDLLNIKFMNMKIEVVKNIISSEIFELKIKTDDYSFGLVQDNENKELYHIKDGDNTGTLEIKNDLWVIRLYENEIVKTTIEITNNNDIFRIGIVEVDDDLDMSFDIRNNEENTVGLSFTLKEKDTIDLNLSGEIKKIDNGYNKLFTANILSNGDKLNMTINGKTEYGDNLLKSVNIDNYKEYDNLSEEEVKTINENLYKKLEDTKLLELMSNNQESYS